MKIKPFLNMVDYREMAAMAASGAMILQLRVIAKKLRPPCGLPDDGPSGPGQDEDQAIAVSLPSPTRSWNRLMPE
jgi:hypothetical protein